MTTSHHANRGARWRAITALTASARAATCAASGACHGAAVRRIAAPRHAAAARCARGTPSISGASRGAAGPTAALTPARGATSARILVIAWRATLARATTCSSRSAAAGAPKATPRSTVSSARAVRVPTAATPAARCVKQASRAPPRVRMTPTRCGASSSAARRALLTAASNATHLSPASPVPSCPSQESLWVRDDVRARPVDHRHLDQHCDLCKCKVCSKVPFPTAASVHASFRRLHSRVRVAR
jgi:hypothetical protein